MPYDLMPANKELQEYSIGAFSWPIILQETGMGYILNYGLAMRPGSYSYQKGNSGSPVSNDGYIVTEEEAKMMARVARGYLSVKRFINSEWGQLTEEQREQYKKPSSSGQPIYQEETSEASLKQIEDFADFAEKSGGFSIH